MGRGECLYEGIRLPHRLHMQAAGMRVQLEEGICKEEPCLPLCPHVSLRWFWYAMDTDGLCSKECMIIIRPRWSCACVRAFVCLCVRWGGEGGYI